MGKKVTKAITSPNAERIKRGMPVTHDVRSRETGHIEEKQVTDDPALVTGGAEVNVEPEPEDISSQVANEWK